MRRVITRPESAGGEDFEGVTEAEFRRRKAAGVFALDWQAHGLSLRHPPRRNALAPAAVLFNGSRAALPAAIAAFPDLRVILVTAPDAVLSARLAARGRETADDASARLARAGFALPQGVSASVVMNDATPSEGIARLLAALQPESA